MALCATIRVWTERLLRVALIGGLSFLVLFGLLSLIFPLRVRVEYATTILDDRGEVIRAFLARDQQWRMPCRLGEVSPLLKKTILAKEDRWFYYHPGVNALAILRALAGNLLHLRRESGASTITMQVARALEPGRRTYFHKLREMFRALQLETVYSKDRILELYLNLVPYGGNIQGVKAAALMYFGKAPDHLSLAEITALSIIPNRPSSLVPGRNNDRIVEGRNRWLRRFASEGLFTAREIDDALHEPLVAWRRPMPSEVPHLAVKLRRMYGPGEIRTFIALNKQRKIEKLLADYTGELRLHRIRNSAAIVLDNRTHRVIAYAGSADFHDTTDAGQVNGAAAIRQPGSTLKPLLYALCLDEGFLTPRRVIHDVPVNFQGYAPENFDRSFKGNVTMTYALEHSLNIPAVRSLHQLGTQKLIDALTLCRFRQVTKDQRKLGLSMVLGGCGATLEELTGLYSVFASDGLYSPLQFCTGEAAGSPVRIASRASVYLIDDILSRINRPDFPLNWQSTVHLPKIAWKTGTSYGRRDGWSIGYNARYTVGVWVGNFSAVGAPDLSGAATATPLLFRIFNTIDYDDDQPWFAKPPTLDTRIVCTETGLPPGENCRDLVTDDFLPGISATTRCGHLAEVMISADGKMSYCRACAPASGFKRELFPQIDPDMQRYYDENHIAYTHIPPHNPACEKIFREAGPVITNPATGNEYLIGKKNPQPLALRCQAGNDVSKVYWYINNRFYRAASVKTAQFFLPEEGPVKISCTDDKGRNRDIWIRVRYVEE